MTLGELIKLIWRYLRPYKKMVYFCIFLAAVASAISAVIPIIYGRLVDTAIKPNPNLKIIALSLVSWLIFVLVSNWITRFVDLKGSQLGNEVFQAFTTDIYYHYLQLPLSFHKDKRSGEQMNKINRAGNYLWDLVGETTFYLLPSFLTAIIALTLMFMTEWRLTLVIFLILFFYTLATIVKNKPIIETEKKSNKLWEKVWGHIYDSVHNVQIVKSHIKEVAEYENVSSHLDKVKNKMTEFFIGFRNLAAWQNNIQGVGFVVIFALSLYFLIQKQITTGILVSFIGYVNLVFRPFNQLSQQYRQLQRGLVNIGRAVKLFEIEKELYGTGKKLDQVKGKIEFRKVSFAYEDKYKKVLKNINFMVEPGQVVALVGESGAGKTTLVGLISRYYELKSGQILLDGVNIKNLELTSLRQQIAIVPQEVSLFNDTLKKNLVYARQNVSNQEIIEVLKAANAWEFVSKFPKKLNQRVGERGIKLSTGQKQRIAIARAILRHPKILILDEATSSLDSVSEKLVQAALKNLIIGRTTFIIAHRLSTIVHADKILVFDKGDLAEQGRHDELVQKQGIYWNLYQKQRF